MSRILSKISANSSSQIEEPSINLTPLIDVVFVILIMFILIAPLLEQENIDLASGRSHSDEPIKNVQYSSPITIHVRKDQSIWMDQERILLADLTERLKEKHRLFPKTTPQLFHDKEAYFGTYQSVKNSLEEAGFTEIDLILKPA